MIFHGYELTSEWKNSQCGQTACAKKGGKNYFLKKYQTPVAPIDNGTLDAKTFAHNKELFEYYVNYRLSINSKINTIAGAGGNIVIPCDSFIEGNHYVEASEFVEGAVDEDELEGVLASLSVDVKKLLMQTAAGALYSVHSKGIVHSDLKIKNVLLVRNTTGNYVAKLIDFDSSYFVDNKPQGIEIIGTIDYYSPELGAYAGSEDESEDLRNKLTEKSDIFSLGLIFHYYLSGELPVPINLTEKLRKRQEKGKVIYCWVALNNGCDLQLSPLITSPKYLSLIRDMLSLDPNDRPTASEVLKRLRESEPVIEEPWPEHTIILDKEKLRASGVLGLEKLNASGNKIYRLTFKDGRKSLLTKEDLESRKYVSKVLPVGFCEPWSDHSIVFDIDRIKSRGFVSSEQTVKDGIKGYLFFRADSNSTFFKVETLLGMKYAKNYTPVVALEIGFDEPWPEHKIVFDIEAVKSRGFSGFKKDTLNGINGYTFTKSDGKTQFIRVEMVIIQKMAKKL